MILKGKLAGRPSDDTLELRKSSIWKYRFSRIWNVLTKAFPKDRGVLYHSKLRNIKYLPGKSIVSYNQEYRTLISKCRNEGRKVSRSLLIDDYLASLPVASHPLLGSIAIQVNQNRKTETLDTVMTKVEEAIKTIDPLGLSLTRVHFANYMEESPKEKTTVAKYNNKRFTRTEAIMLRKI